MQLDTMIKYELSSKDRLEGIYFADTIDDIIKDLAKIKLVS